MTAVRRAARAKANPFLRVLGRRPDRYHEIETLLVRLASPADEVTVVDAEALHLEISGPKADAVPPGEENLAWEAARSLAAESGRDANAAIRIEKHIPVAAGLGGGSADAAAVLLALDELWELGLGTSGLEAVATAVGSDVPALLLGGAVIARGRGERLEPVDPIQATWFTVTPDFGISAADAYRWWDEDGGPTGPDPEPLVRALREGDREAAGRLMFNDLEAPILRRHPELADTKAGLLEGGALGAIVCGSGPTVLALIDEGFRTPAGLGG